jgi:hypothetical protein
MILKKADSQKLTQFQVDELIDRMHRRGHTGFCFHTITQSVPNPDGNTPKEICIHCGEEV